MNLGLKGIGIATVIANLLLCIYCLIDLSIKREIAREYLKFNKDIFKDIDLIGPALNTIYSTGKNSENPYNKCVEGITISSLWSRK